MNAPAPDEAETLHALRRHRPDLVDGYGAALPAARAAVLRRLWGALWREGIVARDRLTGPEPALFGPAGTGGPNSAVTVVTVVADGTRYDHPTRLLEGLRLGGHSARLARELDNSVANLALALANSATTANSANSATGLVDIEQAVVDGHPLHPCCRTRIGMTTRDVLAYAPEHRPRVDLAVVDVDPARWRTAGTPVPPRLPVHPWQLPRALATGLVRDTGTRLPAHPLMSLRTLALGGDPAVHLKTAVEVQMTSAVRTLSAPAVHNGPLASALVARLTERTTGLNVLRETTTATVLDDAGDPQRALGAVWRQAPPADALVVPLAALPGRPDLLTPAFFTGLVDLMLPPLLTLLHLGVALEAHGQNTLVEISGGRPVRLHYRDLGGLHVHAGRLAAAGYEMPPLVGALPTDDEDVLRTKLFAAAFATVLTSLAAALGDEQRLWDHVAAVAREAAGNRDDERALFAAAWPLKATTAMRLADDPLEDRWCAIPNPIS
ncbi:IucA/IucC family siderophore biosynthesis protein [Dactylosporangium roseum]|uniref:IucA/IucC family siderophore biosynthesis protein n=1 Tax=Dactylosporangium roseum TaxID=47989 RepID=A0ABY5YYA1_9ACTN|nr:IucA/IucC family siderophore biosynthesis protein [Dactylosporangium roseum]UWZ33627.1 IucA/IucC family siderophore biosynthesis protein [Dactylosporangium roseum]